MTTGKGPANSPDAMTAMPCRESPAPGSAARERALRTLSPAECLGLPEAGGIGRVGFASADGIKMLPVNFAVTGKAIIFRTAPDTLLAVYADGQVSFEPTTSTRRTMKAGASWCKVTRARTDEREVKRFEDRTDLEPWAGDAHDVYARITPARISGRCIEPGWASPLAPDTKA